MRVFNPLSFAALTLFFISCSSDKPVHTEEKEHKVAYALRAESIYNNDSIGAALARATFEQRTESRRYFMNGLALFANKGDAAASIEYFKEAICYYPDEKSYTFLIQACLRSNQVAMADTLIGTLFGRVDHGEVMFYTALVSAAKKDTIDCLGSLEEAAQAGFIFKDRIVDEPLFDFLRETQSYSAFMVSYFSDDTKTKHRLFRAFAASFPDLDLPFEMSVDSAKSDKWNEARSISYDFSAFVPGMDEGRFSRDVSNYYLSVGKFRMPEGVAFIYKKCEMIADTLNPVTTLVMTYDTLGNKISEQAIACFCSPLESRSCVIGKDYSIEVKSFKMNWEYDPLEKGYAGNRVVSVEEKEKWCYRIFNNKLAESEKKADEVASAVK